MVWPSRCIRGSERLGRRLNLFTLAFHRWNKIHYSRARSRSRKERQYYRTINQSRMMKRGICRYVVGAVRRAFIFRREKQDRRHHDAEAVSQIHSSQGTAALSWMATVTALQGCSKESAQIESSTENRSTMCVKAEWSFVLCSGPDDRLTGISGVYCDGFFHQISRYEIILHPIFSCLHCSKGGDRECVVIHECG